MPVKLEKSYLDKFVNGYFLGKRQIGRPIKYNIRTKDRQGWVELVFNPRTRVEQYTSNFLRFIHPYLFHITYKFHVEKAREAGKFNILLSIFTSQRSVNLWSPSHLTNHEIFLVAQSQTCTGNLESESVVFVKFAPLLEDLIYYYRHARGGCLRKQVPQRAIYYDALVRIVLPSINSAWACAWRSFLQKSTHHVQRIQSSWLGYC